MAILARCTLKNKQGSACAPQLCCSHPEWFNSTLQLFEPEGLEIFALGGVI